MADVRVVGWSVGALWVVDGQRSGGVGRWEFCHHFIYGGCTALSPLFPHTCNCVCLHFVTVHVTTLSPETSPLCRFVARCVCHRFVSTLSPEAASDFTVRRVLSGIYYFRIHNYVQLVRRPSQCHLTHLTVTPVVRSPQCHRST